MPLMVLFAELFSTSFLESAGSETNENKTFEISGNKKQFVMGILHNLGIRLIFSSHHSVLFVASVPLNQQTVSRSASPLYSSRRHDSHKVGGKVWGRGGDEAENKGRLASSVSSACRPVN